MRIMLNNCYHKKEKFSYKFEQSGKSINEKMKPLFNTTDNDANKPIHNRELGQFIEVSLLNIPQQYRMVFSLREISGLNVAETSEILQISPSNVKARLSRAKSMLRSQVEKTYSALDLYEFNLIYCDAIVNRVMHAIEQNRQNLNESPTP